jgi:hypothetical protein
MGECSEGAAFNSGGNEIGVSYSCKADDVGSSPQEDRSVPTGAVGKAKGGKEGCVEKTEPAANKALGEATWLLLG